MQFVNAAQTFTNCMITAFVQVSPFTKCMITAVPEHPSVIMHFVNAS